MKILSDRTMRDQTVEFKDVAEMAAYLSRALAEGWSARITGEVGKDGRQPLTVYLSLTADNKK
jgi:hypothetical protein